MYLEVHVRRVHFVGIGVRQVVGGTVDDDTYAQIEERLGTRGLVEYTGFILWLQWIIRMMQALGTHTISDAEVEAILSDLRGDKDAAAARLRDAGFANPDFKSRIA